MRQAPVKASIFTKLDKETQELLIANGAVPVSDTFFPYWENRDKVFLLYGSYGSGKSVFIADLILARMLSDKYLRALYGRKVFDTNRISTFKTFTDRIEERGLEKYFNYSKAENSSMVIKCIINGNTLTPFGADRAEKLKSVKDPSLIFCEELDQFSLADFGVLFSRLRTKKAKTQFIGAFNTTAVKPSHWLKETFFSEKNVEYEATKLFCNYYDNFFLNHEEYKQTLMISAAFNEQKFREIANGEWGAAQNDNTFLYSFRNSSNDLKTPGYCHVTEGMKPDYSLPLILSFDFNVEPITCSVWQHASDLSWISGLQEYRILNSDIFELCNRITTDHPGAYYIVTGDASGKSRSALTRGNRNYFAIIKELLSINNRQFVLPNKNPSHTNTRALANSIFEKHPAILLNSQMKHLITDINSVLVSPDGGIDKSGDKHLGHLLDTMLYYFYNFHSNFLKKLYNYV